MLVLFSLKKETKYAKTVLLFSNCMFIVLKKCSSKVT